MKKKSIDFNYKSISYLLNHKFSLVREQTLCLPRPFEITQSSELVIKEIAKYDDCLTTVKTQQRLLSIKIFNHKELNKEQQLWV